MLCTQVEETEMTQNNHCVFAVLHLVDGNICMLFSLQSYVMLVFGIFERDTVYFNAHRHMMVKPPCHL